jgi:predicted component of type VI protein secretion system
MARRSVSIDDKIARQKEAVAKARDKYEAALEDLKTLMDKKRDMEIKELINSEKSLDEILAFMNGEIEDQEWT